MKLLKIHIDNFGVLSNYDLNFDDKLTAVREDNGKGKTTIATFITVMLYGMNKNLKDQKDREHFYPFNEGTYGGRLVFSHEGDTYEVWREFHKTSKAKDTLRIFKNHLVFEVPDGKEIGEEVYGIDESAFRRVCFMDDNGLDFTGESIANKLGGLAGDFDAIQVDETLDKIVAAIKEIKPLRGNGGLLGEAERSLSNTEYEISRINGLQASLMETQKAYHDAIAKRNQIRQTIASIQTAALNEERKKNAQAHFDAWQAKQKEYDDLLALYPKGIPTIEEIEAIRDSLRDIAAAAKASEKMSAVDVERLKQLSGRFAEGAPNQQQVEKINADISELESLNASLSSERKPGEVEEDIVRRFAENAPEKEDVASVREKLASYKNISLEYENTDSTLSKSTTKTVERHSPRPVSIALIAFGCAALIGGVVSCFFLLALGIVLIAVGILSAVAGVVLLVKGGKPQQVTEEERIVNPKKQSLGEQKDSLRREISTWLGRYYISDPDPISGMAKFESEYGIYLGFLQGQENKKARTAEAKEKIESLKKSIDGFFRKYGYQRNDYRSMLLTLQKDVSDYANLNRVKEASDEAESKRIELKKNADESVQAFCAKYKVEPENIANWLVKASKAEQDAAHSKDAATSAKSTYEAYLRDNPISDMEAPAFSIEELQSQEADLNQTIAEKRTSIDGWEHELESLDGLLHEQQELKNKIEGLKRRHKILSCVRKNIAYAQEAIKEKYVGPIKKEFDRYSNIIRKASGLSIDLDANLELKYYANGEYRKSLHLSDGEKMLVSFCLRLALLENMYKGSEIFAVLDDPFATLDGSNLPKVLKALKELSGSTQILYFTCHESRMPA